MMKYYACVVGFCMTVLPMLYACPSKDEVRSDVSFCLREAVSRSVYALEESLRILEKLFESTFFFLMTAEFDGISCMELGQIDYTYFFDGAPAKQNEGNAVSVDFCYALYFVSRNETFFAEVKHG